jgi:L-threonylcarbamoyladenylate synthase
MAVERAYEIKGRPAHKPLTLFVRDPADWRRYADHPRPGAVDALVEAFWPGPLNLVLRAGDSLADAHDRLTRDGTVSVGSLSNPVWRELTGYVDGPVAMTSANRSGAVADDRLVDVSLARDHVGEGVDYIVAGEAQGTTRASTIVDLTVADGGDAVDPDVLRRGDVTRAEIRAALADW